MMSATSLSVYRKKAPREVTVMLAISVRSVRPLFLKGNKKVAGGTSPRLGTGLRRNSESDALLIRST